MQNCYASLVKMFPHILHLFVVISAVKRFVCIRTFGQLYTRGASRRTVWLSWQAPLYRRYSSISSDQISYAVTQERKEVR